MFIVCSVLWIVALVFYYFLTWDRWRNKELALLLAVDLSVAGVLMIRWIAKQKFSFVPRPVSSLGKLALTMGFLAQALCFLVLSGIQPSDLPLIALRFMGA